MRKIILIDHSYHEKTKSSNFIIDLLKEKYRVEILYDHSWKGGDEPDLSHIDDSYQAILFWQCISKTMIQAAKNQNLIFFPMYDASGNKPVSYWNKYRNLKIVNFSRTLNDKLQRLGFQSIHVQFFPKPIKYELTGEKSIFFWHRRREITWNTVRKLFPDNIVKVHVHRAVDPGQRFVSPSRDDEFKYGITYSDWFENRIDYYNAIDKKAIYIAPRIAEGIGFSFLEAMALGKVVVAADKPTMNEYIKHGVNGLLFDPDNPRPLRIDNIQEMQKNAYETIVRGRQKWEKNKYKILDFIESKPR